MTGIKQAALAAGTVLMLAGSGLSYPSYGGSGLSFVLFTITSLALFVSLVLRPNSAFFTSLGVFFLLGFWLKFVFSSVTGAAYIEPTGQFMGAPEQWSDVLFAMSAAFAGLTAAIWAAPSSKSADLPPPLLASSPLYARIEKPLAAVSVLVALLCFGMNWPLRLIRTGLDPVYVLPFGMHIIVSYIILWGAALWLGCMGYWAWRAGRLPMWAFYLLALCEALVSTVSNLSRARYLFHVMGFALGLWRLWAFKETNPRPLPIALAAAAFLAFFGSSIVLVSWERIGLYRLGMVEEVVAVEEVTSATAGFQPVEQEQVSRMAGQVSQLFISRWIGVEGLMSVAAWPEKNFGLLMDGITERPDAGNDGIYERISDSHYRPLDGRTFTTTAGSVAILFYSGSALIVFAGVFLLGCAGYLVERAMLFFTQSPFASSIASVLTANAIAQVNQPYLSVVVIINTLLAGVAIFAFIRTIGAAEQRLYRSQSA